MKFFHHTAALFGFVFAVVTSTAGMSQAETTAAHPDGDPTPGERLYRADEVVVIGHGDEDGGYDTIPAAVTIIDRADFERRAATVADVIAHTPGALVSSTGGLGSYATVTLRGSFSHQVQVFLDGVPLNRSDGGAVDLGALPLGDVERIEIWRSGAPAHFGGDAVGGVINIVTRDVRTTRPALVAGYGSFDTFTAGATTAFPHGLSRTVLGMEYAASKNDYPYTSDNGTALNPADDISRRRENDRFRSVAFLAKHRRTAGGMVLDVAEHFTRTDKGIPALQHIGDSRASLDAVRNIVHISGITAPARFPALTFMPEVYHHYTREHYTDPRSKVGWGAQNNVYATQVLGGSAPIEYAFRPAIALTLTPSAAREIFRPDDRLDAREPLACDREHLALDADMRAAVLSDRLTITGRWRRDRYHSTYTGTTSAVVPTPPPSVFHHFTHLQGGIGIQPVPGLTLRGAWSDSWRPPSFYELFGDRGVTVSRPGLLPERARRRDAAIRLHHWADAPRLGWTLETSAFRTDYRDLIQWYANSYGFLEPSNVHAAYVEGVETVWRAGITGLFSLRGAWTFQRSRVTDTPKSYHRGKDLPGRPRSYGTTDVDIPVGASSLLWRMDSTTAYHLDRANQRRYPGRTIHDAGVTVPLARTGATLTLLVRNIGDIRTFDYQGLPKPGRSLSVTIRWSPSISGEPAGTHTYHGEDDDAARSNDE